MGHGECNESATDIDCSVIAAGERGLYGSDRVQGLSTQRLRGFFTPAGDGSHLVKPEQKIKALNPDVLTLDVEMPKMDGITFLRNLMGCRARLWCSVLQSTSSASRTWPAGSAR